MLLWLLIFHYCLTTPFYLYVSVAHICPKSCREAGLPLTRRAEVGFTRPSACDVGSTLPPILRAHVCVQSPRMLDMPCLACTHIICAIS